MLHNTVNVTNIRGGEQTSAYVIPSEIVIELTGTLLPGFGPDEFISELRQIIGDEVELEVVRHGPVPSEPDMGLFDLLGNILREADPEGIPVPLLLPSPTDGRFFSQLGIQTYGFLPMNLPSSFNFIKTIHAPDERIPVEALEFGSAAIYRVLQQFG